MTLPQHHLRRPEGQRRQGLDREPFGLVGVVRSRQAPAHYLRRVYDDEIGAAGVLTAVLTDAVFLYSLPFSAVT